MNRRLLLPGVFFFVFFLGECAAQTPRHVVSQLAFNETKGSTPIFLLHPAGSRVHGTTVIFHGYGLNAAFSRIQAQALFYKKFNVVAFNVAGFAQDERYWRTSIFRESSGYSAVRKIFQEDVFLSKLISEIQGNIFPDGGNELIMPRLLAILRTKLSSAHYKVAEPAIRFLAPGYVAHGMEKDVRKYFLSGHQVFESDPFEKLNLVQALPGPVHAMGYSFGTVNVLNLIAASKTVSRAVLLAPYVGGISNEQISDFFHFALVAGCLNLVDLSAAGRKLPGRYTANAVLTANLVNRDAVTNSVRENTKTLCIIAEDDTFIDVPESLQFCRSKIAARTVVYPKELKLDHFIIPELRRNAYSITMMEQVAHFLISGNVETSRFFILNSSNPNPGLADFLRKSLSEADIPSSPFP